MKRIDVLWNSLLLSSLIGYFLVMKLLNLHTVFGLRYLILAIHFSIVYGAMKAYRAKHPDQFSFWDNARAALRASIFAIVFFALFIFLYLQFFDPWFMAYVHHTRPFGPYLNAGLVALGLVTEGILGALFSAYVGMKLVAAQEKAEYPVS